MKRRVAILISGRGSNMSALINAAAAADYPAEIVLVISNKPDAAGLKLARASGVEALAIESRRFGNDRAGFEAVLQSTLEQHGVELICLGGVMRVFSAGIRRGWDWRHVENPPGTLPAISRPRPPAPAPP